MKELERLRKIDRPAIDTRYTQNCELSWLKFNERVLEEAEDASVPLYERLKFVEIFTSNLDEFFMVRVGSLFDLKAVHPDKLDSKSGQTPGEQLEAIFSTVGGLYKRRDAIYASVQDLLAAKGIVHLDIQTLGFEQREYVDQYFREQLLPVLSPQIIDLHHPFPHLENKELLVGAMIKNNRHLTLGMVPLVASVPRFIVVPGNVMGYVLQEEIILAYLERIFVNFPIVDRSVFSVTRSAEINPDDEEVEYGEDYLTQMKKVLKKRKMLPPVRLEVQTFGDSLVAPWLSKRLDIPKDQVFTSKAPLTLSYVYGLEDSFTQEQKSELCYPPYHCVTGLEKFGHQKILDIIHKKDILLQYPYEDFGIFLEALKEAVNSPDVLSIKITIYRVGHGHVKLMNYLSLAAELGKEVTVLLELKARFDEQNNMDWVESLRDAGCHILYGFEGYKVHAKVCLITERHEGKLSYVTYVGTGNFNAKTAHLYTDIALMTSDEKIGRDASMFFRNMGISNLNGIYEKLLVAPSSLKNNLLRLIEGEIGKAERGEECGILLKMNSITDRQLIDALAKASQAGVRVDMVVRGICCIVPEIPGLTENIHIHSIVGRFLEHSRVYVFGKGADTKLYIASADWMTRNTENRVEVACPIENETLKQKIIDMVKLQLSDTQKGRKIGNDGCYHHITPNNGIDCQKELMIRAHKKEL